MAQAAYITVIKIGGTSVSFTDESTTNISGNSFQITDDTRRVLDRNFNLIVEVDGIVSSPNDYKVDYLFGVIEFENSQSGDVTVTGNYIPTVSVVGANQYNLDITGDILDDTNFLDANSNGGYRSKTYGITDVSVSISRYDDLSKMFKNKIKDRDIVLLEIKPSNDNETIRGWFVVESANSQGDISSLENESINLQLDGNIRSAFSWRTN